jgi:hypothetical protein
MYFVGKNTTTNKQTNKMIRTTTLNLHMLV